LNSIEVAHEQSTDALSRLNLMEERYTAAHVLLTQDQSALEKVNKSLTANLSTLDANIRQIESRLQLLQEKTDRLTQNQKGKGPGS